VKEQQKNEIKVGLTVLAGAIILFAGFFIFKDWSMGRSEYQIRILFPMSAGLDVGDQVSVNGVRAGKVSSVELRSGGVEVHALMHSDVTVFDNAVPTIQMLELMGGKKIEIRQKREGTPVDDGSLLTGRVDPDVAGALGMLGGMEGNVRDITTQADSLLRGINAIVGDRRFVASIKETVSNLHALTNELRSYMSQNRDNIEELTVNMVSLSGRADTLLAELQPAVTGSLEKSDRVLEGADTLITELRGFLDEVRNSRGLLHTAIHDTTLAGKLDRMLLRLDTLTSIIIEGEFTTNIDLF
jgi:ABC-type transporter Mla subunit MlaD